MATLLKSLSVRAGGRQLLKDVSLALSPGSRTALVGASGAGKSLTCAALAGVLPPGLTVTGSLTGTGPESATAVNLLPLPASRRPLRDRVALVPQDPSKALHPLTPVGRQIELAARTSQSTRHRAAQRVTDLLAAVGLERRLAERVPGCLSGGQRQRACLALALAGDPTVLIADEPTTALDVVTRAEVLDLLARVTGRDDGPALLLITHDLPAAMICEDIVVLSQGEVVERGATWQVLACPDHPVTQAMCEAARRETLPAALTAFTDVRLPQAQDVDGRPRTLVRQVS
ncbi:ABC transporter ATP-binding protein [Actinomyces lilanjuaniae]|uniref:ABC transporter ATP-binding protein n=1 Tax=Actinomyces lilanjuaniae TaxID=2321394 RepID=A0ABN5PRK8_9ACTO|nr:ATP-binding cassette domain-containing protein [Actinomyces lilanjuaniae]AYD90378.1 ABC transporter ATP-binding protein [Actinomyces lilanjuaniae]